MAKTRSELIARQHRLARREESLATIATIGAVVTASMFAAARRLASTANAASAPPRRSAARLSGSR